MKSLLAQTYEDFEIVCVDDGSTDATYDLLSKYCDSGKVRVFRKRNGGQSDARNHGVSKARGEFVTFVDSDDVVSPFYLEALIAPLRQAPKGSSRPFVVALGRNLNMADVNDVSWAKPRNPWTVSRQQLLQMLLYNEITESPWAKLARREVYLRTPFPVGKKYEDLATITSFISHCDHFYVTNSKIYGYVRRVGSIVRSATFSSNQFFDYIDAITSFESSLPSDDCYSDGLTYRRALTFCRMHALVAKISSQPEGIQSLDKSNRQYIQENLPRLCKDRRVPFTAKLRFILIAITPRVHDVLLTVVHR
jgi:glycosyltransferase involved in cell wall biosynthesis